MQAQSVLLSVTTMTFDPVVMEIFWPLMVKQFVHDVADVADVAETVVCAAGRGTRGGGFRARSASWGCAAGAFRETRC